VAKKISLFVNLNLFQIFFTPDRFLKPVRCKFFSETTNHQPPTINQQPSTNNLYMPLHGKTTFFFQPLNDQPTTNNHQNPSDLQIKSKITLKKLCRSGLTCYFCTRIETEITDLTHWKRFKDFTKIRSKNLREFKN